jgi:energy-coupling factor transport system ATP-binding protein
MTTDAAVMRPGGIELATEGLGFVYPDGTRALTDVSVKIAAGSRVAIIGQNGSGKSTLVRHFNGLLRATEGNVLVDERTVGQTHVADLARLVGISFQNPDRQIFSGNVRAEVRFGPRNIGLRGADLDQRVDGALAQVGLTDVAGINPYDLGFSERKLLALASVIAMGTRAIVLDEPTTGQDANGVARVKRIVEELASEGRTVVAISHDMTFVAEAFERVLVMRDGRLVLDAPVGEVFGEKNWRVLESTYLEPPLAARLGVRLGLGATPTTAGFVSALSARDTIGAKRTGDVKQGGST